MKPLPKLIVHNNGVLQKVSGAINEIKVPVENTGGRVDLNGMSLQFEGGFLNAGLATLAGGSLTVSELTITSSGTLLGPGSITGNVSNDGLIKVDGVLSLVGDFTQTGGTLWVEIAAAEPGGYDTFSVTGNATLGGALYAELIGCWTPEPGTVFDVMTYGSHTGEFSSLGGGWDFIAVYEPTRLKLLAE